MKTGVIAIEASRVAAAVMRQWVFAEPEFRLCHCVAGVCCFHVFCRAGYRDVEVEVIRKDGTGGEDDEDAECRVFEIRDLDLHAAEFDTPTYVGVWWRGFESHVLPVCGLEVFEVIGAFWVELFQVFGENDERIPDKEMSKMCCEKIVHSTIQ